MTLIRNRQLLSQILPHKSLYIFFFFLSHIPLLYARDNKSSRSTLKVPTRNAAFYGCLTFQYFNQRITTSWRRAPQKTALHHPPFWKNPRNVTQLATAGLRDTERVIQRIMAYSLNFVNHAGKGGPGIR